MNKRGYNAPHVLDSGPPVVRYKHRSRPLLLIQYSVRCWFVLSCRRSGRYICFSRKGRLRTWVSFLIFRFTMRSSDDNWSFDVFWDFQGGKLCNSLVLSIENEDGWWGDEACSQVFVNQLSALPCQNLKLASPLFLFNQCKHHSHHNFVPTNYLSPWVYL